MVPGIKFSQIGDRGELKPNMFWSGFSPGFSDDSLISKPYSLNIRSADQVTDYSSINIAVSSQSGNFGHLTQSAHILCGRILLSTGEKPIFSKNSC